MDMNLESLLAEARSPATPAVRLAELAQHYPDTRLNIALNPNAYPELLSWLAATGDPQIVMAVNARTATHPLSSPHPPGPARAGRRRTLFWGIGIAAVAVAVLIAGVTVVPSLVTAVGIETCDAEVFGSDRDDPDSLGPPLISATSLDEMLEYIGMSSEALAEAKVTAESTVDSIGREDLACASFYHTRVTGFAVMQIVVTNAPEVMSSVGSNAESLNFAPYELNNTNQVAYDKWIADEVDSNISMITTEASSEYYGVDPPQYVQDLEPLETAYVSLSFRLR